MKNWVFFLTACFALTVGSCGGGGSGTIPASTVPTPTTCSAGQTLVNGVCTTNVVSPPSAPQSPTGVSATAGNAQVTISWTPAVGTGSISYNLYYALLPGVKIGGTGVTQLTGVTSGNPIKSLQNSQPYYFVVTAVNGGGESAVSSEVSATPLIPGSITTAPAGLSVYALDGLGNLSWTAVSGATSYNVYYGLGSGALTGGTKATFTTNSGIVGVGSGKTYYYSVTAVNGFGESPASQQVAAYSYRSVFNQPALNGTIYYNATSSTKAGVRIYGVGTAFTTQLQVGDEFTDASSLKNVWKVVSIDTDTSLNATATRNVSGFPFQVLNVLSPGVTANITLREGYYSVTGNTLVGTQRVSSNYVGDLNAGDVLSIGGSPYTVSSVNNTVVATPGLGRGFVVSLGSNATGLDYTGVVESAGVGYVSPTAPGYADPITVYGSWGNGVTIATSTLNALYTPYSGDFVNDGIKAVGSTLNPVALTSPGAGYSQGALALATGHANGFGSGALITLGAGRNILDSTAIFNNRGANYKVGDILSVICSGPTTPTYGLVEVAGVTPGGVIANQTMGTSFGPNNSGIVLVAGTGYFAGASNCGTVNLGTFFNVTSTGTIGTVSQGLVIQTAAGTVANNDSTLGTVGSWVKFGSCGTSTYVACISNVGSAGAMPGDTITVFNPNPSGTNGTIRIVSTSPSDGTIVSGYVLTAGAAYPNTGVSTVTTYGAVTSTFPSTILSKNVATPLPIIVTAGSRPSRGNTTDLIKY